MNTIQEQLSEVYLPPTIVGVDPSISKTGIVNDNGAFSISTDSSEEKWSRISCIVYGILECVCYADLIIIEGYSFASKGRAGVSLGEVGGIIRWELVNNGYRYVEIPPKRLKKFAVNNGNADKDDILTKAVRESSESLGICNNNHSDAFYLREMGLAKFAEPTIEIYEYRKEVIDSIEDWPEL